MTADVNIWSLVLITIVITHATPKSHHEESLPPQFSDYLQAKIQSFKLKIHEIMAAEHIIHKRESPNIPYRNIRNGFSLKNELSSASNLFENDEKPAIIGASNGSVYFLHKEDKNYVPLAKISVPHNIIKLLVFFDSNQLWLIIHYQINNATEHLQLYSVDGTSLNQQLEIELLGKSLIAGTSSKNSFYVAIISSISPFKNSKFLLYKWKGSQFDRIISLELKDLAESLSIWDIDGILYANVGLKSNPSRIFECIKTEPEGEAMLVQFMEMDSLQFTKHFVIDGIHYLMLVNKERADIHWWIGGQFILWQTLELNFMDVAIDLMVLQQKRNILILVSNQEIAYFIQDDTSHFTRFGKQKFSDDSNLSSFIMWQSLCAYSVLSQFASLFEVQDVSLPVLNVIDPLKSCLEEIDLLLNETQEKLDQLHSRQDKIWMKNNTSKLKANVFVIGAVESTFLKNEDIVISVKNSTSLLPNEIEDELNEHMANFLELTINDAVLKSTNQTIKSSIQFNAQVSMTEGSLNVIAQIDPYVNRIKASQFKSVLKQAGDQIFYLNMKIQDLKSNTVESFSSLNGIKIEELILLEGKQLMTGHIQCQNISGSNINLASTGLVNGVSLSDIILTFDDSHIIDKKSFNVLNAANINSSDMLNLNGIDQMTIFVDVYDQIIENELNFTSSLNILGNLQVGGTVASQLESLAVSSVKTFSSDVINGKKYFSQSLKAANDASIDGMLNNIKLHDTVTLSGAQDIKGNVSFNDIEFQSDIMSYNVNGIDFNKDVITSQNNVMQKKKLFLRDLHVLNDIYMTEDGLINDISISEMQRSVATKYLSVFENSVHLIDINIGNLTINENSNFPIFLLRKQVWVKSGHQEILHPIDFRILEVQNLNVEKLNRALFNTIFIPKIGKSNIKDTTIFTEPTFINTLSLKPFITINGHALSSSDSVIPSHDYMSSKLGTVRIQSMVVTGSVKNLSTLNFMDFPNDFLLTYGFQVSSGKNFSKIYTKRANAQNAVASVINDVRFPLYLAYTVKKHSSKTLLLGKIFQNIYANELFSEGFISNVSLQEFFRRVVMLNASEKIQSRKEFSSITAPEITISALFGYPFSSLISPVVTKDAIAISGVKRFQKLTDMKNINVQLLNGLNLITLRQLALSKTAPYTTWEYVIFQKSVACHNGLKIDSNQALDEVLLDLVPKVNEANYFELLVIFRNMRINHVNVNGLINGCNITKIFKNTLYSNEKVQVFTAKMDFSYLNILKNLNANCNINGVSKSQLKNIVNLNKNISLNQNIYFVNISVHNLLLKTLNGADMSFLISDAVKKFVPQVIMGRTSFTDIETKNLSVKNLHVKDHTNDIYFHELFGTAVTKQGLQTVSSNLVFAGVNSKNVNIKGKLNTIKIPEDVILTGTSNLVDSDVIWNTTITIPLNLDVSGRIDGIFLASELQDHFYLDDDSVVFSNLIFHDDVSITGAAVVKDTLNMLLIHKFVLRNFENIEIEGKKIFNKDLIVHKELTTNRGINEVDVSNLIESILNINIDEIVKHLEFNKALVVQAPLNVTGSVNGVVIGSIWNQIHEKIEYAENESSIAIMLANKQEEFLNLIENPVSIFAYFELHQRIDLGLTLNFRPVIRNGVAEQPLRIHHGSMIVWTDNCRSDTVCCKDVKSLRMKIFANGTLDFVKDYNGKVFKHILKYPQNDVKGFLLQNTALNGAGSCEGRYETVIKTCFISKGKNINFLQDNTHAVINAIFVEVENDLYVTVLYDSKVSSVVLYRYNWTTDVWSKKQQLGSLNPVSLDIIYLERESSDSYIFLAISYNSTEVPLSIYLWDMLEKNFFEWGHITAAHPSSTVFWVDNGIDLFLLVANEKSSIWKDNTLVYVYTDPVQVYKLEHSNLALFQTIDIGGIYSFESFKFPGESYVLAVSRYMQTVYVIQWKGFNRFQVIQAIPSPGVLRASPFFPENGQLMLALSSVSGHSKILRSVNREISLITE